MKKQKKIWISLLLSIILIVVLSGCSGLPKTAKINITIDPNPVPYSSEDDYCPFDIVLDESNGVGVTLSGLRFDEYNQEEQLSDTTIANEEDIIDWFGSNYLPAFSSLQLQVQANFGYWLAPGDEIAKYLILIIEGIDDNENLIEATVRIDILPQ
jgi:hypothetical protein